VADDGNFEASAKEELLLVDDAMVGGEDGADVPLVGGEFGVGIGEVKIPTLNRTKRDLGWGTR
jgi:hypothetical protein